MFMTTIGPIPEKVPVTTTVTTTKGNEQNNTEVTVPAPHSYETAKTFTVNYADETSRETVAVSTAVLTATPTTTKTILEGKEPTILVNGDEIKEKETEAHPATIPRAEKLKEIQDEVSKIDPDKESTQSILGRIVNKLQGLYPDKKVTIEAEFETSGGYPATESYKIPDDPNPDNRYYRIKVTYTVKVEGEDVSTIKPIDRVIKTNATTPENAVLIASKFKDNVIQIAENFGTPPEGISSKQYEELKSQRTFGFNFDKDAAGRPVSLRSIVTAGKPKENSIEFKLKQNPRKADFYALDLETGRYDAINREDRIKRGKTGKTAYYETEEEAILNARYTVKNENFLDRLKNGSKPFQQNIEDLKELIERDEKELGKVKKAFFDHRLFDLFRGKTTKEFKQYIAGREYEEKEASTDFENLSPTMQEYVNTKRKLEEWDRVHQDDDIQQKVELEFLKKMAVELAPAKKTEEEEKVKTDVTKKVITDKDALDKLKQLADKYNVTNSDEYNLSFVKTLLAEVNKESQAREPLSQKVNELKSAILEEQASFNSALTKLHALNNKLERQFEQLQQVKKELVVGSDEAKGFEMLFPKTYMQKLGEKVKNNKELIKKIIAKLEPLGASEGLSSKGVAEDEAPKPTKLDEEEEVEEEEDIEESEEEPKKTAEEPKENAWIDEADRRKNIAEFVKRKEETEGKKPVEKELENIPGTGTPESEKKRTEVKKPEVKKPEEIELHDLDPRKFEDYGDDDDL
jgi:hypothetical protein